MIRTPMTTTSRRPGTFAELWQRAVDRHADRPFLVFRSEDGEIDTWTYDEFDGLVRDTMALLAAARRRPRGRGAPVPAQLPRVHRALARHHGARRLDGARRPGVDEP